MEQLLNRIGNALCWTAFAPIIRWHRRRQQTMLVREDYDRRRIDSLLNHIMFVHSDLLG